MLRGRRLLLLGAPGVGKGTYGKLLSKSLGLPLVTLGDVIRGEIEKGSEHGKELREFTRVGRLAPDDLVLGMMKSELGRAHSEGFILDGFPRTTAQAEALELELNLPVDLAVQLELLRDEFIIEKLLGRRLCSRPGCGKAFNVAHVESVDEGVYMPALLPPNAPTDGSEPLFCECGSPLVCREDDTRQVISERLQVYHKETHSLLDFYHERGVLETFTILRGLEDLGQLESTIVTGLKIRGKA